MQAIHFHPARSSYQRQRQLRPALSLASLNLNRSSSHFRPTLSSPSPQPLIPLTRFSSSALSLPILLPHPALRLLSTSRSISSSPHLHSSSPAPMSSLKDNFIPPQQQSDDDGFIDVPALPAYKLFNLPIVTSQSDSRSYRIIRLQNDLEAVLVHDPKADKAAASMDVNVGHLSDPEHLQGLAHFCEHLLFMGNQKYPSENEYSEYLAKNSGHSNAFTGMDNTVYFFDIHPSALDGALDRFSQFFVAPIFSDSCTEREIRAVDSENSKNLQADTWRMFQLDKATSSRKHSFWRFGTGNIQTLWERPKASGVDVRQELLKFYNKHYSSNVMHLAVLGNESLDELTRMVVQNFSPIANKHVVPDRFDGSPFTERELGKLIFTKMVKDTNLLEITFPIPDQSPYYDTQPIGFISHHIGHEGVGSITSHLKQKGWVNVFQCGSSGGVTGFDLFKITLDLTVDGLGNLQQVVQVIFAYLDLLRATPPQEWAFKEQALLSEIRFRFKSPSPPSSYVSSLASWLRRPCPKEKLLSSIYLTNTFDPELIKSHLDLLRPNNCRILVGTQAPLPDITYDQKEQWYGTEYTIKDLPAELCHSDKRFDSLALPPPNSFLSTNFDVDKRTDIVRPARRPKCLSDTELGRVWHKKDDRWWLPRATVIMVLRNPIINATCANTLKTHFIAKLLKDALNEQLYEAELAGLSYVIGSSNDALMVNVDGYNEKLHLLLETVLKALKNLKVERQKFKLVRDEAERKWKNFVFEGPYSHASYWMDAVLSHVHYNYEQKLAILDDIKPEDIQAFIPQVTSRAFVETLIHGNLTETEAKEISELPSKIFSFKPVKPEELQPTLPLVIPEGSNFVYERELANASNANSAVDYFIDVGDLADHSQRRQISLLAHLMHEACFNQLRTREQLGYMVSCYTRLAPGQCGLKFAIQSEREPAYVESRIEAFLEWFGNEKLALMEKEEFEEMKTALVNKALEDYKNMWDESSHYWMHINTGYYAFRQREEDAEAIKAITKEQLMAFYRRWIDPASPQRAKCSTQVRSQHVPVPAEVVMKAALSTGVQPSAEDAQFIGTKPDMTKLKSYLTERGHLEMIEKIESEIREEESEIGGYEYLKIKPIKVYGELELFKKKLKVGNEAKPVDYWKADE